jgi:hypothetical protein
MPSNQYYANVARLQRRVLKYARALEGELNRNLLRAWDAMRASMTEAQIASLVEFGQVERVVQQLALSPDLNRFFGPVRSKLTEGSIDAAKRYTIDLPTAARAISNSKTFDVLSPKVVAGIATLNSRVLNSLATNTAETIRTAAYEGIKEGMHPRAVARRIRDSIGLAPNQERAVSNFRKYLTDGDRTALHRKLRDKRFDKILHKALGRGGTGLSQGQIDKMSAAYRRRMVAWNAETQMRTAAMDAQRLGQKLAWEDAVAKGAVDRKTLFKQWAGTLDSREREEHILMEGEERHIDENFSNGEDIPGDSTYNCRCLAVYSTKEQPAIIEKQSSAAPSPIIPPKTSSPIPPPSIPDSGLHALVSDLDLMATEFQGPAIKYKRRRWDGAVETVSHNINKRTLNARTKALTEAHAKAFGGKRIKVHYILDEEEWYGVWRNNTQLSSEIIRLENIGPPPAFAKKATKEVFIGPDIARRVVDESADIAMDGWSVVAHELTHTVSGKVKALSSGLEQVVEEGANEILTKWFMAKKAAPSIARMSVSGTGESAHFVFGLEALARHTAYTEYVTDVVFTAARRVGWNRKAIIDEVARVFRLKESARQEWFTLNGEIVRFTGPYANTGMRSALITKAEESGVRFNRIEWTAKDLLGDDDIETRRNLNLAHNIVLWLLNG